MNSPPKGWSACIDSSLDLNSVQTNPQEIDMNIMTNVRFGTANTIRWVASKMYSAADSLSGNHPVEVIPPAKNSEPKRQRTVRTIEATKKPNIRVFFKKACNWIVEHVFGLLCSALAFIYGYYALMFLWFTLTVTVHPLILAYFGVYAIVTVVTVHWAYEDFTKEPVRLKIWVPTGTC